MSQVPELSPEFRKSALELVVKAYEHHKTHARFEETQRAWMVTAFFTFTGLIYVGVSSKCEGEFLRCLYPGTIWAHLFVNILFMISISKVSGEFRRHFTRAEKILIDVKDSCLDDEELKKVMKNVVLETAAFKDDLKSKRPWVVMSSNAAVHAYLFCTQKIKMFWSFPKHLCACQLFGLFSLR